MTDKNGKEMKTGDVVLISGAYFKNDNGMYKIEHSPGDANWTGKDYSLRKLNKNGTTVKNNSTGFWPILVFINDPFKYRAAKAHNAENAKIEVIEIQFKELAPKKATGVARFVYNGIKLDGELYRGWYSMGKYRNMPQGTIVIYAKSYAHFPKIAGLTIENDTDTMTDYFDTDRIYVKPDNKHYADVKAAFEDGEKKEKAKLEKKAAALQSKVDDGTASRFEKSRLNGASGIKERLESMAV
jgi:hypothetical protein